MDHFKSAATMEKLPLSRATDKHIGLEQVADKRVQPLICPAPVRISPRIPSDKINSKTKNLLVNRKDPVMELLSRILNKEDIEDDADDNKKFSGFFCGSPPVRTDNPLIHDAQFIKNAMSSDAATAAFTSSLGGKPLRWGDGFSSCSSSSSFVKKPGHMVRIEGFACGNSESGSFVSTFA